MRHRRAHIKKTVEEHTNPLNGEERLLSVPNEHLISTAQLEADARELQEIVSHLLDNQHLLEITNSRDIITVRKALV